MSTKSLLDPELLPALEAFPDIALTREVIPMMREAAAAAQQLVDLTDRAVTREEVHVPGLTATDPAVRCLLYRPAKTDGNTGGYVHIHGGGYMFGSPEMADESNAALAEGLGIVILSVDYRLAPDHPVPAPLDDCYAALAWMHGQADDLKVDRNRIAVGGESAGGGLAAGLVQRASGDGAYKICFQLLTYPMLDDRTGGPEQPADPLVGEFIWTRARNQFGWSCFLGDAARAAPYVPARAEALDGLPPAWIGTAALDLFRDENIDYAQRLLRAGVATELIVYPGACHGFQWARDADVSRQFFRDHAEALGRALAA